MKPTHLLDPAADASEWDDVAPVPTRARHDGWTPTRQKNFLVALAECGVVSEACARVGMSPRAAYALRRRPDADHFRRAWDAALDYAVRRLSDAAFSRALNGVTRPVFYQGEQVGERTFYDERLTMFVLRYRDPMRYGKWLDAMAAIQPEDGAAALAEILALRAERDAHAAEVDEPAPVHPPLATRRLPDHVAPPPEKGESMADLQRRWEAEEAAARDPASDTPFEEAIRSLGDWAEDPDTDGT
ncbi:hypothetical protein WJT74_11195 [Sphingomicrobium sp. XHP0239]|uniref:hypothetical protein n=1 Tax=Sphingomicrobium maritimum TaxID=3133972 RepID=UPI0031CCB48F